MGLQTFEEWVKKDYEYVGMQFWRNNNDSKPYTTEEVYSEYLKQNK